MGDIVLIHPPFEIGTGKKLQHIGKRRYPFPGSFGIGGPVANMLFRPEEIHGASGIAWIFKPSPERHGDVSHITRRFPVIQDPAILKHDPEGFAAIEAGEI
jgi:hypothetical protein